MAPTIFSSAGTSNENLNTEIEGEIHAAIADLSRRLQQLHTLHTPRDDNNQSQEPEKNQEAAQEGMGIKITTLSGQNNGATMNLPGSAQNNMNDAAGKGGQRESVISSPHTTINIYINNNVQGVNNSILYNSSCKFRDPGVRLDVSTSEIASSPSETSPGHEEKVAGSTSRAPALTTLSNYTTAGRKRSLTDFLNEERNYSCVDSNDQASCVEGEGEGATPRSIDEWRRSIASPDIDDLSKAASDEGSEFRTSNFTEFIRSSDSKSKPRKVRFLLIRKLLRCSSSHGYVAE